jgi:branched-chain amino acid transport system substrate-binding protein
MKQAANLNNFAPDMVAPGIRLKTTPDDYFPLKQFRMMQFEGERWNMLDGLIEVETPLQ